MYPIHWVEELHMSGAVPAAVAGAQEANPDVSQKRDDIHSVPLAQVYEHLGSRSNGLTQQEAAERLYSVGPNSIRKIKGKPLILRFIADFTHLMALLLWVGGVIAFVAGMSQLGYAICW